MELNYKLYGAGDPLIILHGFMGSLDNWHTLSTRFGHAHQVYNIDQRNHGKSPHSSKHSLTLMVADLVKFIEANKLEKVSLIGHSMGGKVAMRFALEYPQLVNKLVVVDIAPRKYQRGHDEVFEAIFAVDLKRVESRKDAEQMMEPYLQDEGTKQFLLKNLDRRADGSYGWKMNLKTLHEDYEEIVKPIESDHVYLGPTLVIKGGRSKYISQKDETDFYTLFPACEIQTIENAGHWVHAEAPEAFFNLADAFLNKK